MSSFLEPAALHQTRFRTPGVQPDARGVVLGQRGVCVFPSLDRAVAFFRAYGEEGSLDELLGNLQVQKVVSSLRTREILVSVLAESSYRMDRVAAVARLAGGEVFTGTQRHFVRYRDAKSPLGYDLLELANVKADVVLYAEGYQQAYNVERDVPFKELVLKLQPYVVPTPGKQTWRRLLARGAAWTALMLGGIALASCDGPRSIPADSPSDTTGLDAGDRPDAVAPFDVLVEGDTSGLDAADPTLDADVDSSNVLDAGADSGALLDAELDADPISFDAAPDDTGAADLDAGADDDGGAVHDGGGDAPADLDTGTPIDAWSSACSNGVDDDLDGAIDASDSGCGDPTDDDERGANVCDDGIDNDGDARIDFRPDGLGDSSCTSPEDPSEDEPECSNGRDDDGDGRTDLGDPGCSGAADASEHGTAACDDGFDNDFDARVDFRLSGGDPGCSSPTDDDEANPGPEACRDGVDNDCDGRIDFGTASTNDPGCSSATDNSERRGSRQCDDGGDNDGDGTRDYRSSGAPCFLPYPGDPACSDPNDNDESI